MADTVLDVYFPRADIPASCPSGSLEQRRRFRDTILSFLTHGDLFCTQTSGLHVLHLGADKSMFTNQTEADLSNVLTAIILEYFLNFFNTHIH